MRSFDHSVSSTAKAPAVSTDRNPLPCYCCYCGTTVFSQGINDMSFADLPESKSSFNPLPIEPRMSLTFGKISRRGYWIGFAAMFVFSAFLASIVLNLRAFGIPISLDGQQNPLSLDVILVLFPLLTALYTYLQSTAGSSSADYATRARFRRQIEWCFVGISMAGLIGEFLSELSDDFELRQLESSQAVSLEMLANLYVVDPARLVFESLDWTSMVYCVVLGGAGRILLALRETVDDLTQRKRSRSALAWQRVAEIEFSLRRLFQSRWTFPQSVRALHRKLQIEIYPAWRLRLKYAATFLSKTLLSVCLAFAFISLLIWSNLASPSSGWLIIAIGLPFTLSLAEYVLVRG